jgi:hypothetical protein
MLHLLKFLYPQRHCEALTNLLSGYETLARGEIASDDEKSILAMTNIFWVNDVALRFITTPE